VATPTISPTTSAPELAVLPTQGPPQVLRRPLGFPVGEGAPGPVAVVLGTRPEAIKLAEIVRRLGAAGLTIHTGQHYDAAMWSDVTAQLGFGSAPLGLGVGGTSRGAQLGAAVAALDATFAQHKPSAVVVQGDTTAALAGALAGNAADLPVIHVEAGLRSFDRRMPEEHNRVVIDHLAELCCAPTSRSVEHLRAEGIPDERILLTGNTVVESVLSLLPSDSVQDGVLAELGLPAEYLLLTVHRPENADNPDILRQVFTEMAGVVDAGLPVVFPAHPRTLKRLQDSGFGDLLAKFTVIAPQPPAQFLALSNRARLIVSDSGGVQEEVSVLKKRLIVVRRSTERPEVMGTFASLVPGGLRLRAAVEQALAEDPAALADLPSPYGDGSASRVIVESIVKLVAPF